MAASAETPDADRPDDTPDDSGPSAAGAPFRVAFAPGVTPGKWADIWARRMPGVPLDLAPTEEDRQVRVLRDGSADMSFVRLPVDRTGLHVIPLYHELPVVVVAKDHVVTAYDEVPVADLADEHLLQDPDDVPEWRDVATELRDGTRLVVPPMTMKDRVELVAAGSGILIVPMSVARLHHRKDVTYRVVTGVAETQVGLAWPATADDPRIETFIGIVRGRTEHSSRSAETAPQPRPRAAKPAGDRRPAKPKPRHPGGSGGRRGTGGGRRRGR